MTIPHSTELLSQVPDAFKDILGLWIPRYVSLHGVGDSLVLNLGSCTGVRIIKAPPPDRRSHYLTHGRQAQLHLSEAPLESKVPRRLSHMKPNIMAK